MRQSSAGTAIRAMVMLACVVGIPVAALSGVSWEEMVKKFQGFRVPDILPTASASTSPPAEAGRSLPAGPADNCSFGRCASLPGGASAAEGDPVASDPQILDIQGRLRQLGATYYVLELLEAWNQQPPAYRFYCTLPMARAAKRALRGHRQRAAHKPWPTCCGRWSDGGNSRADPDIYVAGFALPGLMWTRRSWAREQPQIICSMGRRAQG